MLEFGLTAQEFKDQYLEQQCYLRKAALTERPVQWTDIDQLLPIVETDHSVLQLFKNGQLPPDSYSDESVELGRWVRRLNKHRFYGLLHQGATMVLNRIENYSVAARRLCTEVARFTAQKTTSNAYVSFSGDGTFGKHWDTHDVVVIQLLGKKRWQVFAPTHPLPLSHQTSEQLRHECPHTPVFDCVLDTGDLLYIPRGWWHNVIPFAQGSLHLSVGVYVPTVNDYIMWACNRYLLQQVQARSGLLNGIDSIDNLHGLLRSFNEAVLDERNIESFRSDLQTRERLISEFNMQLFVENGMAELRDDCLLMLTFHSNLKNDFTSAEMRINGGRIKLEPVSRAIAKALANTTVVTFAELCNQFATIDKQTVRQAVLDLASHEIVTIRRSFRS